jgi:hypothetical protein
VGCRAAADDDDEVTLKRRSTSTRLLGPVFHKVVTFILATMQT